MHFVIQAHPDRLVQQDWVDHKDRMDLQDHKVIPHCDNYVRAHLNFTIFARRLR